MATSQTVKEETLKLKVILSEIDRFVLALTERLQNPNKTILGKPASVSASDNKFQDCPKAIQSYLGDTLNYRSLFGNFPPQYKVLQTLFTNLNLNKVYNQKYDDKRLEFLHRMRNLMLILSNDDSNKVSECKPYVRVLNLLMSTTTSGKDNFKYAGIYRQLREFLSKADSAKDKKEVDELVDMALELDVLERRKGLPNPPTGSISASTSAMKPEEPRSNAAASTSAMKPEEPRSNAAASTSAMKPEDSRLSALNKAAAEARAALDAMKKPTDSQKGYRISQLKSKVIAKAKAEGKRLTNEEVQTMAENMYANEQSGKGRRKTYRKKHSPRKSRKVRHV
jgi:hypothetical protein